MRRSSRQVGGVLLNGLLLAGLIGLLFAYAVSVTDLPSLVYTAAQRQLLEANSRRSISQLAPTWNVMQDESSGTLAVVPVRESHVRALLAAGYEEHGGIFVTVYSLEFHGDYLLRSTASATTIMELVFPFPTNLDTLHEVLFLVDGEEPAHLQYTTDSIIWRTMLGAAEEHRVTIGYKADGAASFAYSLPHNQRSDVDVTVSVSGLTGSQVHSASLPPSATELTDGDEIFTWDYQNLIASRDVRLTLPARLSFAQRVARLQDDFRMLANLAPLLIAGCLISLAGLFQLSGVRLRLESYLLCGFGLALFYPLLTFLSALVNVAAAAVLSSLIVSGLLISFWGLAVGWRRSWWRVAVLLGIFLGAFSLGMLTPWRGLLITTGGLILAGMFMAHYSGWATRTPDLPEPCSLSLDDDPAHDAEVVPSDSPESTAAPDPAGLYCPRCGRELHDDYGFCPGFCPGCGHDTQPLLRCTACGTRQFVEADFALAYCLHCGQRFDNSSAQEYEKEK